MHPLIDNVQRGDNSAANVNPARCNDEFFQEPSETIVTVDCHMPLEVQSLFRKKQFTTEVRNNIFIPFCAYRFIVLRVRKHQTIWPKPC